MPEVSCTLWLLQKTLSIRVDELSVTLVGFEREVGKKRNKIGQQIINMAFLTVLKEVNVKVSNKRTIFLLGINK